ncbi:MAG: FixH family protein [Deltaproteobacteria bacterium]|jgi:hypothetical protein|nr:FixH family protein [Deltaproteobacteria bacterium]MCL5879952.1 FixH family protein [Deltaproteobacteria bacterium]MDA8304353.1 FixH family protein [Deltaproteobacteria bacterium]
MNSKSGQRSSKTVFIFLTLFLTSLSFLLIPQTKSSFGMKPFSRVVYSGGYRFKTVMPVQPVKFTKLRLTLVISKNGAPANGFRGTVSLSMPAMYMGKNIAKFVPESEKSGAYKTYIYFTMGGLWKLNYALRNKNGKLIRFSQEFNVN